jgi:hypothetical protein
MRFFNTSGPIDPEDHYCIPPLERLDRDLLLTLIEQKRYFVLHAPRQTGKTTSLRALLDLLNQQGQYRGVYLNVETAQAARENVSEGVRAICQQIAQAAQHQVDDPYPASVWRSLFEESGGLSALGVLLAGWARQSAQPLVLVIDEIDTLIGDTLISVLRQIRTGYPDRPEQFPSSIILCGVRDVRDYRIYSHSRGELVLGGSAFNIKARSLRMGDFSRDDVEQLLAQHTTATGQRFLPEAIEAIWTLSNGQPWLVNALAYEVAFEMRENLERTIPIIREHVQMARESLILRRETHLDQLTHKLREDRVRRVIELMLGGRDLTEGASQEDLEYCIDLGLVAQRNTGYQIANPIYAEIIPRQLTFLHQSDLEQQFQPTWYLDADGRIDMTALLSAFQNFFRQHSEHWVERFEYREVGPQLLLQAFLQRIVNGVGRIEREYGLGRRRTDLLVIWPYGGAPGKTAVQEVVIELKILHGSLRDTITRGIEQTAGYMDRCGAAEGHLIIFDRREQVSWDEKLFQRQEHHGSATITVWGM